MIIFSNSTITEILIELKCPYQENMEKWHDKKVSRQLPLTATIESNDWSVHLVPVELGAKDFCSSSIMYFHALGLHNRLVKSTIKELSKLSRESFFCILLNRNN